MKPLSGPRLLVVAPSAYPLGGLATWLDYLIPGLMELGWDARLALASGYWHQLSRYLLEHPATPILPIVNPTGSREGRVRALWRLIKRERPQLLLVVNMPDAFAAVRRMRGQSAAPRVAMAVHALESAYFDDIRRECDLLDGVIGANRLACRLASVLGKLEGARVFYGPGGVQVEREARSPSGRRLRLVFAGRLEEESKRVSDLCAIVERLAIEGLEFQLEIVGDGPEYASMRRRLIELEEREVVAFRGRVGVEELRARIFPACDVLIHTSVRETGPLVIWEAMAQGVAVVTSRYLGCGLEGSLRSGENCLQFDVGDVAGAAAHVRSLADASLRSSIAEAGVQMVRERYSVARSVALWNRALNCVLDLPARDCERSERIAGPAGRLDRWLGVQTAESLRACAGLRFRHASPGGEWPHSYAPPGDERAFIDLARAIDESTT